MKTITFGESFWFGKHRDMTLEWVVDNDPGYIVWASKNLDWLKIDPDAVTVCEEAEEANSFGMSTGGRLNID